MHYSAKLMLWLVSDIPATTGYMVCSIGWSRKDADLETRTWYCWYHEHVSVSLTSTVGTTGASDAMAEKSIS